MKKYFCALLVPFVFVMAGKAQGTPAADAVLQEACAKASGENKNVMVIFHASWCGWCRKMDTSLNDPSVKEFFNRYYVVTHLTINESPKNKHLENAGAKELNEKWGGKNGGIPFWVIMDREGKILAHSKSEQGRNVGCPASAEEVAHFIKVLKKTSPITAGEIVAVEKRFRKNE